MAFKGYEDDPFSRLLQLQWRMSREINGEDEPLVVMNNILDLVMELDNVAGVWVWFRETESGHFKLRNSRGIDPVTAEHLAHAVPDSCLMNNLILGNEVISDWEYAWEEQARLLKNEGWSEVSVWPLCSGGKTFGALGVACKGGAGLSSPTLLVLRTLSVELGGLVGRARTEADLRNSRFNHQQIFQSFADYVFISRRNGQILYSNADEVNDLDLGVRSAVGSNIEDYLPGFCRGLPAGEIPGLGEGPVSLNGRLRVASGGLVPVEVRSFRGRWDEETVVYFICRDISQRVVMERERARLITAIEHSDDSIIIADSSGLIQFVNPAFTRLTGYTAEDAINANPRFLKSGVHSKEFYREMWATLGRGEVWKGRLVNRCKNGDHFTEMASISPIRDQSGIITHFVAVKRDVTQEIQLEERLRQSQKMEAIGTLAGGLAHDFNNILYALLGYCQLAMDDVAQDHPAQVSLEEIRKAGNRASSLVAKMLTLGCRHESNLTVVNLKDVVQEALVLARASLPTTIDFDIDLQDCRHGVESDPVQIHQVVLNLCTNANHAMRKNGGRLTVRLTEDSLGRSDTARWPGLLPGKYLKLVVADNGVGMKPETRERIFEPYFTTKDANEGTGLGLATVQGIMLNHQGRIFVESEVGKGTKFTMFFPAAEKKAMAAEETGAPVRAVAGTGRIMVVDDESMIIDVATKALTRLGFEVVGFTDGIKALEVFERNPEMIDVVVTDQTMPKLNGFELASRLLSIRPDLPIIMTTGYSELIGEAELSEAGIRSLLAKPLKIAKLAEAVSELLNHQAPKVEV
jgi:PAS domain S-box-containing protein